MNDKSIYNTDIIVKFDDTNKTNTFLGVSGDSNSRLLTFKLYDSKNNELRETLPTIKLLVKGEYDSKVYYNVAEKIQGNEYKVLVPSQIFTQAQTVKMQLVIEDEENKQRLFTSIINQEVKDGLIGNAIEGTNIYIDYEEIHGFEDKFNDFLNSISQDKEEILLEMSNVKDENKAEILLLKGDFEQASKDVLDTVNKLKDETVEFGNNTKEEIKNTNEQFKSDLVLLKGDFEEASEQAVAAANKAKEEAIAAADTVKEEIGTASEQAIVEIKKELGVIKTETVEEMNSIKLSTIADVTEKGNQINASLTENKDLILTAIAEKETSTINKITEKESEILLNLQTKIDTTKAEITELANTEIEKFKGLATEEISKAVEDLHTQIEESKSGVLGEISDLVATSKDEISQLKTTSIADMYTELEKVLASITSKETDSLAAIDNATQEAIESIVNEAGEAVIPPQVLEDIKSKASKQELEEGLGTKAEKVHKHEISDVNTLTEKLDTFATNTSVDDKLSKIELKDTAIDVVSESKKLDIVLKELREKDTLLTSTITTTSESVGALETKVAAIENELGIYSNRIKAVSADLDSLI